MILSLIAAVADNGVIGRDNDLPWRLPADLKRFKSLTMGKPMIMGRKTWNSIGRPLPGRASIVVTRDAGFAVEGALVAHDAGQARTLAEQAATELGADEIMVIGGAAIYRLFLPDADRLYLTEIHMDAVGDTHFPDIDRAVWVETARERHAAGPGEDCDCSFVTLNRKTG